MAVCALAEVTFDIDRGHSVSYVWPPGCLSEEELSDVAFNAFPDSMSMELQHSRSSVRDSSFCFRVRRRAASAATPPPHPFLYAHVFCRQRQDERLRRGCEQKSIVLLSCLPLHGLLEPLARLVAPAALSYGPGALREAYTDLRRWPPLEWGCRMALPVLGMEPVSVALPLLTALPGNALPAAVAAALPLPEHHQQQLEALEEAAAAAAAVAVDNGSSGGELSSQSDAAAEPAAAPLPAIAPPQPLPPATPAQVAAALADELDGHGLPLCLLPQAYGQQELEASPFGEGASSDCYTPLRGALPQLWALWELLLLGEPLMVVAPSPGACSATVLALLSLLAPFPYSLDFRPYFSIHDPAFARLAAPGAAPTAANGLPMVLGVTNLYFFKALPDWPNVLSTGHTAATLLPSSSSEHLEEAANGSNGGSASGGGIHPSGSAASVASSSGSVAGSNGPGGRQASGGSGSRLGNMLRRRPASAAVLLSQPIDHCWLAYKPCSRPDSQVLDRLVQPQPSDSADKCRRLAALNSSMLRRHFQALTKALLFPLLPYITPCLPPAASGGLAGDPKAEALEPPPLQQLDVPALLELLSAKEYVIPEILLQRFGGQRGVISFYERFLKSPNLVAFMHLRRLAAAEWQRQEWAAARAAAAAPMRELLQVEAFFLLEQQLAAARQQQQLATAGGQSSSSGGGSEGGDSDAAVAAEALAAQLQQQLQLAFGELPEDLQQALLQTPSHASLLNGGGGSAGDAGGGSSQQQPLAQQEAAKEQVSH